MKLTNYLNKSSESVGGRGVETDGYRMFFTRSRFFINLLSANAVVHLPFFLPVLFDFL